MSQNDTTLSRLKEQAEAQDYEPIPVSPHYLRRLIGVVEAARQLNEYLSDSLALLKDGE